MSDNLQTASSTWHGYLWYESIRYVLLAVYGMLFSLRLEGSSRIPKNGPVIIVANHFSSLDPSLIGMAVERHVVFLARKTLFKHKLFAKLLVSLNTIPIDRDGVAKEGLQATTQFLRHGRVVVMFPEGERSRDGNLQRLRPGIHLLMRRAPCTIVPVGIAGTFDAFSKSSKWPRFSPLFLPPNRGSLALVVGKPIPSSKFTEMTREQALEALYLEIEKAHQRAEAIRRK